MHPDEAPQAATQLKGLPEKYLSELVHASNLQASDSILYVLSFLTAPFLFLSCCPRRKHRYSSGTCLLVLLCFEPLGAVTAWQPEALLSAAHQKPQVKRVLHFTRRCRGTHLRKQAPNPEGL